MPKEFWERPVSQPLTFAVVALPKFKFTSPNVDVVTVFMEKDVTVKYAPVVVRYIP